MDDPEKEAYLAKIKEMAQQFESATKLWQLLEIALADMRSQPGTTVRMRDWLNIHKDGSCVMCLAGAVMRTRYTELPGCYEPLDFHASIAKRFYALDWLRAGEISLARQALGVRSIHMTQPVVDFHTDPLGWHRDMDVLLARLKRENL